MSEHAKPPTRRQVVEQLRKLLTGEISRDEVSRWASPWTLRLEEIEDKRVCCALEQLAGADTPTPDRPYLFGEEDFREWLRELTA